MVVRGHDALGPFFRDLLPTLPYGGCAVFDHVTPAGIAGLGQQLAGQILIVVLQQQLDDVAGAHVAGGDVGAVSADVANDVLQHCGAIRLGNDVHIKGDGIAALAPGTDLVCGGIIIGFQEGLRDAIRFRTEIRGFFAPTQDLRHLRHQPVLIAEERRSHQTGGRDHRHRAAANAGDIIVEDRRGPVAHVGPAHDAVGGIAPDIAEEALRGVVVVLDHPPVSVV